jgi:hypothetical protein
MKMEQIMEHMLAKKMKVEIRANQSKTDAGLKELKEEIKASKEEMKTGQGEMKSTVSGEMKSW